MNSHIVAIDELYSQEAYSVSFLGVNEGPLWDRHVHHDFRTRLR